MSIKQVICVRKDLSMRRGKEISQGSHSSSAFLQKRVLANLDPTTNTAVVSLRPEEVEWMNTGYTKITVQVHSEVELRELHQKALDAGLEAHLITDLGHTEFHGVPTPTALCIGPDEATKIDQLTSTLKLY